MVYDLLQLIEAKAIAERLAYRCLVEELVTASTPEAAVRIQARLNALRSDPAMASTGSSDFRNAVLGELSKLIGMLDEFV